MVSHVLLPEVEQLQEMLVARAQGGGSATESEYRALRGTVLADATVSRLLPDFVQSSRGLGQFWSFIKNKFPTYRERREFLWDAFRLAIDALEKGIASPTQGAVSEALSKLDAEHMRRHWSKALERAPTDPDGAITSARTLLESTCKLILDTQKIAYEDAGDLTRLYKQAAKSLKLGVEQHEQQVFKQILSGCASVVGGLASLRNSLGDAHGQGAKSVRAAARHAQLAVNLAGSMATFLLATFEVHHGAVLNAPPEPEFG